MKIINFDHHKKLNYINSIQLRKIPKDKFSLFDFDQFFSFRQIEGVKPHAVIKNLHAAKRPIDIYGHGSVCFYGIQSDSPLAPLILWDAAHFLEIGQSLTIVEDSAVENYLDREYFKSSLICTSRSPTSVTYQKFTKLPAETDDDLDSWTFGLPVGPEDATVLNAVVKRILELDIPNKEILLCGTPGANFKYFDKVRIVGEDITAPPVQICKKKNRLVQEASYKNLVILHDRVFLPLHFGEMVRRFGPRYPLMTLQSLFFDNRLCLYPRRYSDFGMAMNELGNGIKGLQRNGNKAVTVAPSTLVELEKTGFCFANPVRYQKDMTYPTGSLYICRKEVWQLVPLDESLHWVEYEDIEHGIRASKLGIPIRVNPFGISQSITSRALLGHITPFESIAGKKKNFSPNFFSFLQKKPLIRLSAFDALARLQKFSDIYIVEDSAKIIPTGLDEVKSYKWFSLINDLVQRASFSNNLISVRKFINDFERLVLLDQLPDSLRVEYEIKFFENPVEAKRNFVRDCWPLKNMLKQRPFQSWFYISLIDYFHKRKLCFVGIIISAFFLYIRNGEKFYFPSFRDCVRAIYNSTPFDDYTEEF